MQKDDRFAAVLEQFVVDIRLEHQRQLDALNAEIASLKAGTAPSEESSAQGAQQLPEQGPDVYTGHGNAILSKRTACGDGSPDGGPRPVGRRDGQGGAPTAQGDATRCAGSARSAGKAGHVAKAMHKIGSRGRPRSRNFVISECHADHSYEPSSCRAVALIERIVHSWAFDMAVVALVVLNMISTAIETQTTCKFVAEDWGYSSGHTSLDERARLMNAFAVMETVFGVGFVVEIVLRIVALRIRFFFCKWNWIDLALVAAWFLTLAVMLSTLNPMMFRVFRIVRIFRLVRLVRRFKEFDALCLMLTAMKNGVVILGWASCLIFFFLMFLALLYHEVLLHTYLQDDSAPISERQEIYRYFGTFTKTLFSMFELMLANWPPIARALSENVSEWFMLVTILHKLTIGFALVGIINAVFIQETFKVAQEDTEILWRKAEVARKQHAKNMRGLMQAADLDQDGRLSAAEFRQMFDNPALRSWLASQDVRREDADELFDLMDEGDGRLTVEQITEGMARLKGTARAVDLHILMKANRNHTEEQLLRLRGSAPATTVGDHTRTDEDALARTPEVNI